MSLQFRMKRTLSAAQKQVVIHMMSCHVINVMTGRLAALSNQTDDRAVPQVRLGNTLQTCIACIHCSGWAVLLIGTPAITLQTRGYVMKS